MLHHRLTLTGTDDALTAAGAELVAMGVTPVTPGCFITSRADDARTWRDFANNHPSVRITVDVFDEFEDELIQTIVTARGSTTLSRRSVLPETFGCFCDDGKPLPKELLTSAGRVVAADRLAHDVGTLSSHLDDALTMAKALGRFCEQVEPAIFAEPREVDLDAVREIAVVGWWIAVAPDHAGTAAELEFDHALMLTQAVVQAGREELWDTRGHASWMSWAEAIIACAAEVIETGSAPDHAPDDHLAFAARSLLATCIQALALFEPSIG